MLFRQRRPQRICSVPQLFGEGQVSWVANDHRSDHPTNRRACWLHTALGVQVAHRSPHTVGPTDSDPDLADRTAAGSCTRSACGTVGWPVPTPRARRRAARVDTGHRVPTGYCDRSCGRSAPLATQGSRCDTRGGRAGTCVPCQHWRGTLMGSTAHRLRDTRDRVTKSTRRAHASQRRADRTIDTSRTPVRRHLRSPGAAHHSTPHTPHSAKDTYRVLRCHCRLLQRPAVFPRRP